MKKLLFVLLPLLLLQGCSSNPEAVEPVDLPKFKKTFDVDRLWHRGAGIGNRNGSLMLAPVVTEQHLYSADLRGRLYCFDRANGKKLWRRDVGLRVGGIGAGYGYLIVGTRDGDAVALDASSGEEKWRVRLSSEVLAAPAISADKVVFQTLDGRVVAMNPDTGDQLWSYEEVVPILTLRGTSSPLITNGRVYTGYASGKVVALDESTGVPVWERRVAEPTGRSELDRLIDVDANIIVEGGGVFAVTFQGKLAVLDDETGRPFWDKDMSSYQQISSSAGTLFISDDHARVWSVDQRTGSALWKSEALYGRILNGTAIQKGLVVTGDREGYLHWFDAIDGKIVARRFFDADGFAAPPVVYDDILYVLSGDGELAAYSIESLN